MTDTVHQPQSPVQGRAMVAACLIIVASVVIGVAGGLIWAAVSPRVLYQVVTLNPPTAYATNPETSAFIAADGWYCLIAVVGGALIGLLGYLGGVRRYGPVPMAGIAIGATAAAFVSMWLGHRQSGAPGFNHVLATSKPGALLYAPISLGSQGALAFWPLAAAAVAGGIVLIGALRARQQGGYDAVPMPGMDTFSPRPHPDGTDHQPGPDGPGEAAEGQRGQSGGPSPR